MWISFKYERLPNLCYGRLTHDDRDCELWIESEGILKVEQRGFGPQLRVPPFVATRKNAILVLGYYAEKKKVNSSSLVDCDLGQFSNLGQSRTSKQSQSVTADRDESIDDETNSSLIRNKRDENRKEDTTVKVRMNEGIDDS